VRQARALHKLAGIVAGPLILVAALTALGLNHQDVVRGAVAPAGSGPFGKYVLSTGADPHGPSRLLVGTNDGLFRSEDGGRTWADVVLPVPAEQVGAIAFDPARAGVVYVAFRSAGVWRSADGGWVWEDVALPFKPHEGVDVAGLALTADGGLVAATPGGVWRRAGEAGPWTFAAAAPRKAEGEAGKTRVQLMYDLHDGRFWRDWGVPVTDAVAIVLTLLVASGYLLVFQAWWLRRRRRPAAAPPAAPAARELAGKP
jgi:hypothetical protein